jgi:hypothetical protein
VIGAGVHGGCTQMELSALVHAHQNSRPLSILYHQYLNISFTFFSAAGGAAGGTAGAGAAVAG